jgi:hypothetical protein
VPSIIYELLYILMKLTLWAPKNYFELMGHLVKI